MANAVHFNRATGLDSSTLLEAGQSLLNIVFPSYSAEWSRKQDVGVGVLFHVHVILTSAEDLFSLWFEWIILGNLWYICLTCSDLLLHFQLANYGLNLQRTSGHLHAPASLKTLLNWDNGYRFYWTLGQKKNMPQSNCWKRCLCAGYNTPVTCVVRWVSSCQADQKPPIHTDWHSSFQVKIWIHISLVWLLSRWPINC